MKIALYIDDGVEQIVLTPETETERGIVGKLHDGSRGGDKMAKRNAHGSGLLAHIEAAEQQANRDGFHITAHALNRAKNVLGWEMAGEPDNAARAAMMHKDT